MSEMVRKQIYIQKRQERLIKHLSKARGISEAEIIRQAIEGEAVGAKSYQSKPDHAAWEEILRFVESRKILPPKGRPYQWKRQDAYAERERRFK
jgi:hypothetical protein